MPYFQSDGHILNILVEMIHGISNTHSNDPPFGFGTHGNMRLAGTGVRSNVLPNVVLSREIGREFMTSVRFYSPPHPSLTLAFEADY